MSADLKISTGFGTARPTFSTDLFPAELDKALGSEKARKAWEAANDKGAAAGAVLREAQKAWTDEHPQHLYADHATWILARDAACRELEAAVDAAGREAVSALRAYYSAQRANGANVAEAAGTAATELDERAAELLAELRELLPQRDRVARIAGTASPAWTQDYRLTGLGKHPTELLATVDLYREKSMTR